MKTIRAYKTEDGEIFEDKRAAEKYEKLYEFAAQYNDGNSINWDVSYEDMLDWMNKNYTLAKGMLEISR